MLMSRVELVDVRRLLASVVGDERAVVRLDGHTPLRDALPDLDSLAVAHLLLAIEERHGLTIDLEDVDDTVFATPNALRDFIDSLLERRASDMHRSC